MLRWISSFLRQSLVLVRCYRYVEFDLPKTKTKNVTVGGILSSTRGASSSNLATLAAEFDALAINRRHLAVVSGVYSFISR